MVRFLTSENPPYIFFLKCIYFSFSLTEFVYLYEPNCVTEYDLAIITTHANWTKNSELCCYYFLQLKQFINFGL